MSESTHDLIALPARGAWIYVLWNAAREPLYVGQVVRLHPLVRIDDHSHRAPWWDEATFYSVQETDVTDVDEREYETIQELRPKYNLKGNGTARCGTLSGYGRHMARKEPVCEPCRDARNAHRRNKYHEMGGSEQPVAECGTYSGYFAHRRRGERPCDACREANRVYHVELRQQHGTPPGQQPKARCGTNGGYYAHLRRHEPPCVACEEARRQHRRERKEKAEREKAWQNALRAVAAGA